MKKVLHISESVLHRVIHESLQNILSESYNSELYHFTNVEGLYGILNTNSLSAVQTDDDEVVCLSRTGNPYIGYCPDTEYGLIFRIALDTEKVLSSIRGIKIKPWSQNNPRTSVSIDNSGKTFNSVSDYEERANKCIEPLNKYCKSISVYPLIKGDKFSGEQLGIIRQIFQDFPAWKKFFTFTN